MKKNVLKIIIYISILFCLINVVGCAQPSPLTGTWADNIGNQLTLFPDYKYAAKIANSNGDIKSYSGSYNVLMNAISFTASNGYQVVSEWDIRAGMLYLEWPDFSGEKLQLTLFKTKN